ncbi:MAG: glycosyltransferase [Candidatus Omnitrophica bacterium]|nr:glycosyltransferase [Candidatus Omnitrophota bacterium]MCF7876790.1 glycosyltransferase [Candidatus Omnitrophota bacterium]MCF7878236.1 glycosyltransferase [Candidatus Omnitrophota bacterium]
MNILMMTNTYKPIVGGLEKSVELFSESYRKLGHKVLIVAPEYKGQVKEKGVFRVSAIQNFNGTDFSVKLPISTRLSDKLIKFKPEIVHTHHPFLIGDTALRTAKKFNIPLVFTHHTLYERYTHYVPADSALIKKFTIQLTSGYANLCNSVIAPSQTIKNILLERKVKTEIDVIPTGIKLKNFLSENGEKIKEENNIGKNDFVVGFVSRIAKEKNVYFLAKAAADFLKNEKNARFLIVGNGPDKKEVADFFKNQGLKDKVSFLGMLKGEKLAAAYAAMDLFSFASLSETQGLVVQEAMAASLPVVGIDAPGVREVIKDKKNGYLLDSANISDFSSALSRVKNMDKQKLKKMKKEAYRTAVNFSLDKQVKKALKLYKKLISGKSASKTKEENRWQEAKRAVKAEISLLKNFTQATQTALRKDL